MRTQIIATIGPASIDKIEKLRSAGLAAVRINSSHGDLKQHREIIANTRKVSKNIIIIYDIKGPKIRIGDLEKPMHLKAGMELILHTGKESPGPSGAISVSRDDLHEYVKPGHRLLLDDGFIGLKVKEVEGRKIKCRVLYGGILRSRKGINHPDTVIDFPYTVEEDIPFISFAKEQNVDYIADSFERNAEDVNELRGRLGGTDIKIISKIENPEGVASFDSILNATDVVMVARGDLGVELDPWEIPELQKDFIQKATQAKKPVIVATQMLESMIDDPRPKRSDVSDIANALYDGADAVMLSGETSVGKYPVKCVQMMKKIIDKTESTDRYKKKKINVNGLSKQGKE
ncbi:MAG: pyruvate kinase [Elusimicrobiota bacterium]